MTPTNFESFTVKIARSLLGTRIRGARSRFWESFCFGGCFWVTIAAWQPDKNRSRLLLFRLSLHPTRRGPWESFSDVGHLYLLVFPGCSKAQGVECFS